MSKFPAQDATAKHVGSRKAGNIAQSTKTFVKVTKKRLALVKLYAESRVHIRIKCERNCHKIRVCF